MSLFVGPHRRETGILTTDRAAAAAAAAAVDRMDEEFNAAAADIVVGVCVDHSILRKDPSSTK